MKNTYDIVRFESLEYGKSKKFLVEDWDVSRATNLVDLKNYKCFWFECVESDIDEQPGRFTIKKRIAKRSGHYFINGFVETKEDVEVRDKDLAMKMEEKKWDSVVSGINNDWCYGFEDNDNIIELK